MKNILFKTVMAVALVATISAPSYAMKQKAQHAKRVFTFDHDDVINTKEKLGILDYAKFVKVVAKLGWNNPRGALGLLWNWRTIKNRGYEVAGRVEGTSNVIHTLAQELKADGYADLTDYVEEMTAITLKPKPIWHTINYIKELKERGEVVLGATNQDCIQNKYYRQRMAEQGVDLKELFDGTMTAYSVVKAKKLPKTNTLYHEVEDGVFMPTSPKGHKPHNDYYQAVKAMAKKHASKVETVIHTDDKKENITGAQKAGLIGMLFALPEGKSARKCTTAEIAATFELWKKNIEKKLD